MKNILILNDFVSKGKIAARLMSSVLSFMDCEVFLLPTALIANNFSLGKNALFNTNDFINDCLQTWQELEIKFDLIFIGYIDDSKQSEIIIDFIKNLSYKPTIVFDPIMGDDGKLYQGLDDSKIENYKKFLDLAHIIIPNKTEADFLNITTPAKKNQNLIITSVKNKNESLIKIIGHTCEEVSYENVDVKVGGTGDLFDGLFIGYYLKSNNIKSSVEKTVNIITKILKVQKADRPYAIEINIEKYLSLIEG